MYKMRKLSSSELKTGNTLERFWAKVNRTDSCWLWTGSKTIGGYGQFPYKRIPLLAHRVSYLISCGDIPDGLIVCHHCDNPSCVRPDHLFVGTHKDNFEDMVKKGREGIKNTNKETNILIESIRNDFHFNNLSVPDLCKKYETSHSFTLKVVKGITHKNSGGPLYTGKFVRGGYRGRSKTPTKREKILLMYESGEYTSGAEIARIIEATHDYVYYVIRQYKKSK